MAPFHGPGSLFLFPVKGCSFSGDRFSNLFHTRLSHSVDQYHCQHCIQMRTAKAWLCIATCVASIGQHLEANLVDQEQPGFKSRTSGFKTDCSTIEQSQLFNKSILCHVTPAETGWKNYLKAEQAKNGIPQKLKLCFLNL